MRIVGGSLGGRVLRAPTGAATRPTSEKVREAIFNILGPVRRGATSSICSRLGRARDRGAVARRRARDVRRDRQAGAGRDPRRTSTSSGSTRPRDRGRRRRGRARRAPCAARRRGARVHRSAVRGRTSRCAPCSRSRRATSAPGAAIVIEHDRRQRASRARSDLCYERTSVATATRWSRSTEVPTMTQLHDRSRSTRARSIRSRTATSTSSSARSRLFDRVIVTIARQPAQAAAVHGRGAHPVHPRRDAARRRPPRVRVVRRPARRLLPRATAPTVIVRGLRALADFEYEFQFAHMNRRLAPDVDTVFFMTDERNHYVQLVARQGGRQPRRRRHRPRAGRRRRRARGEVRLKGRRHDAVKIASRLDPIKPSITLAVTAKAAKLKADGVDVVSFGAGEPDFDTPEHIKARRARGARQGRRQVHRRRRHRCALRKAIAAELSRVHKTTIDARPDPGLGRRQALALQPVHGAARSRRRGHHPGAVLGQLPRHGDARRRQAGDPRRPAPRTTSRSPPRRSPPRSRRRRARSCSTTRRTRPARSTRARRSRRSPRSSSRRTCSSSPTTSTARSSTAAPSTCRSPRSSPELAERTILVDGVSKTYAMTGWRIGYTAAPRSPLDQGDERRSRASRRRTRRTSRRSRRSPRSPARRTASRRCARRSTSAASRWSSCCARSRA